MYSFKFYYHSVSHFFELPTVHYSSIFCIAMTFATPEKCVYFDKELPAISTLTFKSLSFLFNKISTALLQE